MQRHLPLLSGWVCSRPEYATINAFDTGGFGK